MGRRALSAYYGLCPGCHRPAVSPHVACTCPSCGGPKHFRSHRCNACAKREREQVNVPGLSQPWEVRDSYWLHCTLCGRAKEVETLPPGPVRCSGCGGRLLIEAML